MLNDDSSEESPPKTKHGKAGASDGQGKGAITYERKTRYPGRHDLLLGRGGETNNHSGNIKFRSLISNYKAEYKAAAKGKKPAVSKRLVRQWRSLDPPGRFLAKGSDGDIWEDIGDEAAWKRCSKSLGEKVKRPSATESTGIPPSDSSLLDDQASLVMPGMKRKREDLTMKGSPTAADGTGYPAQNFGIQSPINSPLIIGGATTTGNFQPATAISSFLYPLATGMSQQSAATPFNTAIQQSNSTGLDLQSRNTASVLQPPSALEGLSGYVQAPSTPPTGVLPSVKSPPDNLNLMLIQHLLDQQQQQQQQRQQQQQQHQLQRAVPNPDHLHNAQALNSNLSNELPTAAELLAGNVFTSDSSNSTSDQSPQSTSTGTHEMQKHNFHSRFQ